MIDLERLESFYATADAVSHHHAAEPSELAEWFAGMLPTEADAYLETAIQCAGGTDEPPTLLQWFTRVALRDHGVVNPDSWDLELPTELFHVAFTVFHAAVGRYNAKLAATPPEDEEPLLVPYKPPMRNRHSSAPKGIGGKLQSIVDEFVTHGTIPPEVREADSVSLAAKLIGCRTDINASRQAVLHPRHKVNIDGATITFSEFLRTLFDRTQTGKAKSINEIDVEVDGHGRIDGFRELKRRNR